MISTTAIGATVAASSAAQAIDDEWSSDAAHFLPGYPNLSILFENR
jgi:hypothetical protein